MGRETQLQLYKLSGDDVAHGMHGMDHTVWQRALHWPLGCVRLRPMPSSTCHAFTQTYAYWKVLFPEQVLGLLQIAIMSIICTALQHEKGDVRKNL